jgi:serine/threonine protein kinase
MVIRPQIKDIILGLHYIHSLGVIHGDLKAVWSLSLLGSFPSLIDHILG